MDSVFSAEQLCCFRREQKVCGPVSFTVYPGEVIAVRGINGAGKSSLLQAIAGFDQPTVTGRLEFFGAALPQNSSARCRQGVVLVPEGRHLFGRLTVRENLLAAGFSSPPAKRKEQYKALQSLLPLLKEKEKLPADTLSGGQQQIVAIARGLMRRPKLLLIDEPFLGLSPNAAKEIAGLLLRLKATGLSLLLTCQDDPWMTGLADCALVLSCGAQRFFGSFDAGKKISLFPESRNQAVSTQFHS